eukprot:gnl/TRDRNA2_/TRDRNA2_28711_c0_seq1.p1 gnl/TRDRNA2_/TRDRNA2_28711_c0~~gnl/TRDRNA2_/TRDRNA2_28711_c0_seq1.p1  ORF type:complete len:241 (+),score=47.19 gnl/TRDRNA2_/TRDRNA2_28711_c0_seq1:51-773(+)
MDTKITLIVILCAAWSSDAKSLVRRERNIERDMKSDEGKDAKAKAGNAVSEKATNVKGKEEEAKDDKQQLEATSEEGAARDEDVQQGLAHITVNGEIVEDRKHKGTEKRVQIAGHSRIAEGEDHSEKDAEGAMVISESGKFVAVAGGQRSQAGGGKGGGKGGGRRGGKGGGQGGNPEQTCCANFPNANSYATSSRPTGTQLPSCSGIGRPCSSKYRQLNGQYFPCGYKKLVAGRQECRRT